MPTMEEILDRHFVYIGARARIGRWVAPRVWRRNRQPVKPAPSLDVRRDRRGDYFLLTLPDSASSTVVNTDRRRRHLLLLINHDGEKSRYLCGHDERHWFAAAIPEDEPGVVDVRTALRALMPVRVRLALPKLRGRQRHRRRNPAYLRQGEFFFVPTPNLDPDPLTVRHNQPLGRGWGKFHTMEFAHRRGGTVVYFHPRYRDVLTQEEFDALTERERMDPTWRQMLEGMDLYAMGRITHPDHATVVLHRWHRVFMNTESRARATEHLQFLD